MDLPVYAAAGPQTIQQLAQALQSAAAVAALFIGGLWTYRLFVKNRLGKPSAKISHQVTVKDLGDRAVLVRVGVLVESQGAVLVRIETGKVRLARVMPLDAEFSEQLQKHEYPLREGARLKWPVLEVRSFDWSRAPREIEPRESDTFFFDFIVDEPLKTFEVYSYFKNLSKPGREIGWNTTTIHDVPAPEGPEGLHSVLDAMCKTVRGALLRSRILSYSEGTQAVRNEVSEVRASGTKQGSPEEPTKPKAPRKKRQDPPKPKPQPLPRPFPQGPPDSEPFESPMQGPPDW